MEKQPDLKKIVFEIISDDNKLLDNHKNYK